MDPTTSIISKWKMLTIAADQPMVLRQSLFLDVPGEIRNKIYDHVFGSKTLHLVDRRHRRCKDHYSCYNLRLTRRQIAKETEHYPFRTLDISDSHNTHYHTEIQAQQQQFGRMMQHNWRHVRHLIISSYGMKQLLLSCRTFAPVFPALVARQYEEDFNFVTFKILWPADACNLTTITIKEVNKRKAEEREKLLKVLTFYFPQLGDVRCGYTGDGSCMRRYRISDDAKLMWWYSGEFFKKLPGELTADAWFGRTFSVDRLVQRMRRAKQSDWTLETDLEDRKGGDGAAELLRPAASEPAFWRTFNSARSCSDASQTSQQYFAFVVHSFRLRQSIISTSSALLDDGRYRQGFRQHAAERKERGRADHSYFIGALSMGLQIRYARQPTDISTVLISFHLSDDRKCS